MRKALIVGTDYYENVPPLYGCVQDACNVKSVLERHGDGTKNFDVLIETSTGINDFITRRELKNRISTLFNDKSEIALFYFSGHGYIESTGGYLITSECRDGDDGLAMNDILHLANESPARNKVIILDCCHSGIVGNLTPNEDKAMISEGITILTASSADQYAIEVNGSGIFTTLLVDALSGGAANLVGDITPGSVYAHIDQSLGAFEQRPIFKTNVTNFSSLKKVKPPISLDDLKKIIQLFPKKEKIFPLDPSYEPESDNPNKENCEKFAILQKYNRVNLLIPVEAPHMWHAAMWKKSCKLTTLGKHYWNLVKKERI